MNSNRLALRRTPWMRGAMRAAVALAIVLAGAGAHARLPLPSAADRAQAAEAAAKAAWNERIGQFQLCVAMDRIADGYRRSAVAAGKDARAPTATAACTDPGAYVSSATPPVAKPLEAAGAHSPAATAVSPPSTKAPAAEIATGTKK